MSSFAATDRESTQTENGISPSVDFYQLGREFRWCLILLVAHLPMLFVHFTQMWRRPQYQYFPLVVLAVGYLIASRITPRPSDFGEKEHKNKMRRGRLGFFSRVRSIGLRGFVVQFLLVFSFVLLLGGTIIYSPWLVAVSFVNTCGVTLMLLSKRYFIRNSFGIWLILWLLVPLPGTYDQQLSQLLQRLTTSVSARSLELIGIPNFREGSVITTVAGQLFVEEACSGVVSMMSIVAACLMLAVWANRAWLHTFLLVCSGVVLAAVTNVMRIVIIALADVQFGLDLADGWQHDFLGLCLFIVASALAFSGDHLLCFLLDPIRLRSQSISIVAFESRTWLARLWNQISDLGRPKPMVQTRVNTADNPVDIDPPPDAKNTIDSVADSPGSSAASSSVIQKDGVGPIWAGAYSLVGLFGIVGLTGLFGFSIGSGINLRSTPAFVQRLNETSISVPAGLRIVGFSKNHVERLMAEESRIWSLQSGLNGATFAVDFSFDRWHPLQDCYKGVGWEAIEPPGVRFPMESRGIPYLRCRFIKESGQHGLLLYSFVDSEGVPFNPSETLSTMQNLRRRLQKGQQELYQIQYFARAERPFDKAAIAEAETVFTSLRQQIISIVKSSHDNNTNVVSEQNNSAAAPVVPTESESGQSVDASVVDAVDGEDKE